MDVQADVSIFTEVPFPGDTDETSFVFFKFDIDGERRKSLIILVGE